MTSIQPLLVSLTVQDFLNILDERDKKIIQHLAQEVKPKDTLPEYLTRKQVAKYLSICLASVDNYANKGILTKRYVNGLPRFHRDEMREILNSLTTKK